MEKIIIFSGEKVSGVGQYAGRKFLQIEACANREIKNMLKLTIKTYTAV